MWIGGRLQDFNNGSGLQASAFAKHIFPCSVLKLDKTTPIFVLVFPTDQRL